MSAVTQATGWISPEDYLEGELTSEVRHEYLDGHVYAMAGASRNHNRIVGNILGELRERLRGKSCEPYGSDLKLRLSSGRGFYYPDVMVVCDPREDDRYFEESPTVIFEVLSPETERIDRGEKALAYHKISSVKAYVLVDQDRVALTVLHRSGDGWRTEVLEESSAVLKLPMIGVEIPFDRIYERTGLV